MGYLDCYTEGDLDGHPTTTYMIDADDKLVKKAIAMLERQFDRVELVEKTQGQSPIVLSAFLLSAMPDNPPPTIQNAVENITSESVVGTILGDMS